MTSHSDDSHRKALTRLRSALKEVEIGKRAPLNADELAVFAKEIRPDAETTIEIAEADGEPLIVVRAVKRIHAPSVALESLKSLSRRELEVARLIAQGMTNREIGIQLGIQIGTVKDHVHNILEALNVRSRQGIVALVVADLAAIRGKPTG